MPVIHSRELWNCCYGVETHAIMFDNDEEHAVCAGCAAAYTGPVRALTSADTLLPPRPFCLVCERTQEPGHAHTDQGGYPIVVATRTRVLVDARSVASEGIWHAVVIRMDTPDTIAWADGFSAIESGAEETARAESAEFAAAHDAHMQRVYGEPWDAQPTDCPTTGDPLTGVYGRTYAEGGYLLMQATADLFGPVTGHAPILLFTITNERGESLDSGAMGSARMAHIDTHDTWQEALTAMRWHLDRRPTIVRDYLD